MRHRNERARRGTLIGIAFATMALFGSLDAVRGATLPALRTDLNVLYNTIGISFAIAMFGFILAIYVAGRTSARYGVKPILLTGLACIAAAQAVSWSIEGILAYSFMLLLLQFGGGFLEMGLNAVGAQVFTRKAATGMSLLHLFFGLGSTLAGGIAGRIVISPYGWRGAYFAPIVLTLPLLVSLALQRMPARTATAGTSGKEERLRVALADPVIRRLAILLGLVILLEIGVGAWLVNFLVVERGMANDQAGWYLSLFFATFTAGRLVCPIIAERFGYLGTIAVFSVAAGVLMAAGLALPGLPIAFGLIGLFVSILYPTVMGVLIRTYPGRAERYMGPLLIPAITIANVGNWLLAALHDVLGVQRGFATVLVVPVLIVFACVATRSSLRARGAYHGDQESVTTGD